MNLHEQLRNARLRAGFSQQQLADLLGVMRPTISLIETALRTTTVEKAEFWASLCNHEVLVLPLHRPMVPASSAPDAEEAATLAAVRAALPLMSSRERAVLRMEADLILAEHDEKSKK